MATPETAPVLGFTRAVRSRKPLKICITGPAGSGKTYGMLTLCAAINAEVRGDAPFGVIDTENESASLYADEFTFDTCPLRPPYTSKQYGAAIRAARDAGHLVIGIDSLTHHWDGPGGILERKAQFDAANPRSNSYTNWRDFTRENTTFYSNLLQSSLHMVCTLRSKMEYEQTVGPDGKKKVEKVGLAPIAREGSDYEFDLVFDLQQDHKASVSKDRTRQFDGKVWDLSDADTARTLLTWWRAGSPTATA